MSRIFTQTTDEGTFSLHTSAGEYELLIANPRFPVVKLDLTLQAGENRSVEIILAGYAQMIADRVTVLGKAHGIGDLPGSAHYIEASQLDALKVDIDDIHTLIRRIPGLNMREEDGYGLRPNIGMRGSGSERSSKITLMEDGILIAPAAYSASSAYYFPTAGRMEAIEIRKGSSQIKHGPRTNGGALNLISTQIPGEFRMSGTLATGSHKNRKLHLNLGDSYKNTGWIIETYQSGSEGFKEIDGAINVDSGFNIEDYMGKFRINSDPKKNLYHELEFKLGRTKQQSNETYLGLTDSDFRENPWRRYAASQEDAFKSNHEQYQVRHFVTGPGNWNFLTTVYRNNFARHWKKLQSIQNSNLSNIFGDSVSSTALLKIAKGGASQPGDLKLRNNNRKYTSTGVQTVFGFNPEWGDSRHHFEMGLRFHEDQEDRLQHEDFYQMQSSRLKLTSQGLPGSQSNRLSTAKALAFFVQDEYRWERVIFTPGFRFERIDFVRNEFPKSDPSRAGGPSKVNTNTLDVLVPGVGVHLELTQHWGLFGGLHRGFSPPGPGSNEDTSSEESLNYEFGIRHVGPTSASATIFYNDYTNLLGTDTLSSGGTGEGGLYNGGTARVFGLELSADSDLGKIWNAPVSIPLVLSYTFTDAEFLSSFESDFDPWGNVNSGDSLPYIPQQQIYASIGLGRASWYLNFDTYFVDSMRTRAGQGPIVESLATDSHWVSNMTGEFRLPGERIIAALFLSIRNLANNEYIVARRPYGVRPGLPRTIMAGVRFRMRRP
jgi:Fe(3+) dicitrate transport protein